MDTAVDPLAMERASVNRDAFPISERGTFSAEALRRARIALGEYARTSGMYDPLDVLAFSQLCIREATARLSSICASDGDALVHEVLRVAAAICGLCPPSRGETMEPQARTTHTTDGEAHVSAATSFVAIVADQKTMAPVPPSQKRAMPPQPLGELPDIRPTTLWTSFVQAMRRSTSSLLTSMFARSD